MYSGLRTKKAKNGLTTYKRNNRNLFFVAHKNLNAIQLTIALILKKTNTPNDFLNLPNY